MDMVAAQQRTMKEFLELYNKIVDQCFERCISNFNHAKVSGEEVHCLDACVDKSINFNQRHMMMFMEHQNNKHKLAAKMAAAEAQSTTPAEPLNKIEADPPVLTTSQEQGSASVPIDQAAMSVEKATHVPQNVCYNLDRVHQFTAVHPEMLTAYSGKTIVDQFLDSGAVNSKRV